MKKQKQRDLEEVGIFISVLFISSVAGIGIFTMLYFIPSLFLRLFISYIFSLSSFYLMIVLIKSYEELENRGK